MNKLNGTVTLSILDEDNAQRVIFRIIPLCTKEGYIFQNRKASYPDYGSLRIIPDKREQSSFKERMRSIGNLCCVQLFTDGKELTKIRQNRNYDPNQEEGNQYAIYSDVICGFDREAVFEVFQEDQDHSRALTEDVLIQRGMVLYGPVKRNEEVRWDVLKPFGNEDYLLHTVEADDGNKRTYYWNPEAMITWRQRKKAMKHCGDAATEAESAPLKVEAEAEEQVSQEQIPIGTKLDILNDQLTNEEQITGLNLPVSDQANRLDNNERSKSVDVQTETAYFHGTPIVEIAKNGAYDKQKECTMHNVVERQLKEIQSCQLAARGDCRHLQNPIDNLKIALQEVWQIPHLHQELVNVLSKNNELMRAIIQSPLMDYQTRTAYTAAKAEMDEIEAERIALLVELDKVKTNYQQTKEKMLAELTKQKQDEIAMMDQRLFALISDKEALEETLIKLGDQIRDGTSDLLAGKVTMMLSSNGSDLIISPTIGYHFEPSDIVEIVRSVMNGQGFMCKQDCVTEFLIHLSLSDEIAVLGSTLWEAEFYVKSVIRALGLLNVSAWTSIFGTMHLASLLPENDLRTPTIEVIKNSRTPVKAYGHKTLRLIDSSHLKEIPLIPVIRVPILNKERGQEMLNDNGKPISLQTLHSFSRRAAPLCKDGEAWFNKLEEKLEAEGIHISGEVFHAMRTFARIASPQLVGGFMEAADAAMLAWIVPVLMNQNLQKEQAIKLIGDLPRSLHAVLLLTI